MAPPFAVRVRHLHALVVGCEGQAEVQAEQGLVERGERECLPRGHRNEQQRRVGHDMAHQKGAFDGPLSTGLAPQILETVDLQGDAFEQGEREEQPRLVAGEPAPEA
jgi:hypothetical protein